MALKYTLAELNRLSNMARQIGFWDDVAHWEAEKERLTEVEFTQELAEGFYTEVMQGVWISQRRRKANRLPVPDTSNNESEGKA